MKNLLLLIISYMLIITLGVLLFIFGIINTAITGKIPTYYIRLAISIDTLGNVLGYPLFNLILIKKDGYKFGNRRDTISYVLGVNKLSKKLTKFGQAIGWFLNKIDKNHLEKSIGLL